jgi:hypothetical protein
MVGQAGCDTARLVAGSESSLTGRGGCTGRAVNRADGQDQDGANAAQPGFFAPGRTLARTRAQGADRASPARRRRGGGSWNGQNCGQRQG